jgi:hypothetical protein
MVPARPGKFYVTIFPLFTIYLKFETFKILSGILDYPGFKSAAVI